MRFLWIKKQSLIILILTVLNSIESTAVLAKTYYSDNQDSRLIYNRALELMGKNDTMNSLNSEDRLINFLIRLPCEI